VGPGQAEIFAVKTQGAAKRRPGPSSKGGGLVSWFQVLILWLTWAGSLDQIPSGGEAESPPIMVTLANGKRFSVSFRAVRIA
jgi:hypothetical protein